MPEQIAVTMPPEGWNAVAVLLLENARTLQREGQDALLAELWDDIIPPIRAAASDLTRDLIDAVELEMFSPATMAAVA